MADRPAEVAQEGSAGIGPPDVPVYAVGTAASLAGTAAASAVVPAPAAGHTSCGHAAGSESVALVAGPATSWARLGYTAVRVEESWLVLWEAAR